MAGQKITKTALQKLDNLGEERIMECYIQERSVLRLLDHIKPKTGSISVGLFYRWLHADNGRWGRWKEVKKLIADLLAEETYELSRDTDSRNVQVSRLQVNTNQWLAERYNKEEYGKGSEESTLTISVGASFLAALKEAEADRKAALLADVPEAEFEIVEED